MDVFGGLVELAVGGDGAGGDGVGGLNEFIFLPGCCFVFGCGLADDV